MVSKLMCLALGILLTGLTGCRIETPEIRGAVLDAETKQPVPEAWVHAKIAISKKTLAGDVGALLSVDPPHTRSNEKGEFVIPPWGFDPGRIVPWGFGGKADFFSISAETIDDRTGGFDLTGYEDKDVIKIVVYVKRWERMLEEDRENVHWPIYSVHDYPFYKRHENEFAENVYNRYLKSLYNYCFWGRFAGGDLPAVKGGCDEWELNYAIVKHERFLNRLGKPKTIDQETFYSATLRQLGYLYKRKKDYKNALEAFEKVVDFNRKRNVMIFMGEYESQIKELKEILGIK